MFVRVMLFVWQFVLDLVAVMRMTDDEKDLEIMLLRQQRRMVERKQARGPHIPRWQKVPLAALTVRTKDKASNARTALKESVRLFKPATVLGWHQAMVRRKWTFKQGSKPGRPPIDSELEGWILQVARDNPGLGCEKLEGELRKIGLDVSATTILCWLNYTSVLIFRLKRDGAYGVARFSPANVGVVATLHFRSNLGEKSRADKLIHLSRRSHRSQLNAGSVVLNPH